MNFDHSVGITPIAIRRAAYYAQLGVGEYYPVHPHFDKVVVRNMYDVTQNPSNTYEWTYGVCVDFFLEGRRTRWIEFGCRVTGAGGDDILRKVDTDE
jgi:hypothetical protein